MSTTSQSSESSAIWTLLSPDVAPMPSHAALVACADRHFQCAVAIVESEVDGTTSRFVAELLGARVEARSVLVADAVDAIEAANRAVIAIGGAGFDALVPRTKRVWFVEERDSARAAVTMVAVLTATLLGPVVPPDGEKIFGVRGVRERLARLD